MTLSESRTRLDALKKLLTHGELSTQDELREKLEKQRFSVTQSTISRDLRKLGAVKAIDPDGRTVYRIQEDAAMTAASTDLQDLVLDIQTNGALLVLRTVPGTASLIALHLDRAKPAGILGTIAGEDTVFVAPPLFLESARAQQRVIEEIREFLAESR